MKMQEELADCITRFETIANQIEGHIAYLKREAKYKDLETRLAWDMFYTFPSDVYHAWKDKYGDTLNDSHIDTMLKQALHTVAKNHNIKIQ